MTWYLQLSGIARSIRYWCESGALNSNFAYYKTSTLRVTSTYQIGGLNLKGPRPHPQGRGIQHPMEIPTELPLSKIPTTSDFCTGIPGTSCLVQILPLTQCTAQTVSTCWPVLYSFIVRFPSVGYNRAFPSSIPKKYRRTAQILVRAA